MFHDGFTGRAEGAGQAQVGPKSSFVSTVNPNPDLGPV